jgi:hypothetical protein
MKCISLKQPYLSLIADGRKTIETRTWKTDYRGDVVLVASRDASLTKSDLVRRYPPAKGEHYPFGCAFAVIRLTGCRPMRKADESAACCELYPRAQAWLFTNVRTFPPVEMKGRLGLFSPSPDEAKRIRASWQESCQHPNWHPTFNGGDTYACDDCGLERDFTEDDSP